MGAGLKIVKLGGSVIAPKESPLDIDAPTLLRLAEEIGKYLKSGDTGPVAVVHGGGSFGHPLVKECLETYGGMDTGCYSRVAHHMLQLNNYVMEALLSSGVPAVSIPPRAVCFRDSEGTACDLTPLIKLLNSGPTPVTFGDVILNEGTGKYEVISGDLLTWLILLQAGGGEIIFVTDVEGIYSKDPKRFSDAELIKEAEARRIVEEASFSGEGVSVTGAMLEKLKIGLDLGVEGVKVSVISGKVPNNLFNALKGNVGGTVVWF